MKKTLIAIITTALLASMTACAPNPAPHHTYAVSGHYHLNGTIITSDGNLWDFQTSAFTTDATHIQVIFDDNGTPDNIYDDVILNITELVSINAKED